MNYHSISRVIGRILLVEASVMLLPLFVAFIYRESVLPFAYTIVLLSAAACVLLFRTRNSSDQIYAREGFVIVALSWLLLSAFGALPFVFSGSIPHYIDAFFETVSGFTTTGSTILPEIEHLPKGILFWRSFTHWLGGMGVLLFAMAIMPLSNTGSMHLMRAEVPGPTKGKLVPKMKSTAMILYAIYLILTLIEVAFLMFGGMSLYDSFIHAFGTAGTGGFSNKNISVAYYDSTYIDVVITVFMLLFGVNFSLYYIMLLRHFKDALRNEELLWYLGIFAVSSGVIAVQLREMYGSVWHALRYATFQVSSIMTTTGYATADFQMWPTLSKIILVSLMFFGACAGSTGGGIKTSRIIILVKSLGREIHRLVQPRSVRSLRVNGEIVDDKTLQVTYTFFFAYMFITFISTVLVAADGFDTVTSFTAVIACIGNIGPGLELVGPLGNFSIFSYFSKIVLSLDMLIGRLEIFPILILSFPSTWRRR